jgi:RIO-like serine/threonine protein kinase
MARQAAERQYARSVGRDEPALPDETRAYAMQYQAELARIEAQHLAWLHAQGVDVPEVRARRTKLTRH